MSHLNDGPRVLIIGAGISGLALAQVLRKHNIAFEIFERDDGSRNQGWALGLDKCLPELLPLLPDDIGDIRLASPNRVTGRPDSWAFMHPRTHEIQGVLGEETGNVMVDRNLLRRVLMKNLNVQYNKHLTTYETDGETVIAKFKDGSSGCGNLLVGADGSNSRVRANLLDGFEPVHSRAIMLNGNVQLSREEWEPILQYGSAGLLFGEPGLKGNILLGEYLEDGYALMNWCIAWLSAEVEKDLDWTRNAIAETLLDKAKGLFSHLPSYVTHAVDKTGPEGVQIPPLRLLETVLPDQVLPSGPVTLIGDAAHSMVPFRGMGANTALLDVCDLAKAIISGTKDWSNINVLLRQYEKKMVPRGRTKVLESREIAESEESFDVSGGRLAKFKSNDV